MKTILCLFHILLAANVFPLQAQEQAQGFIVVDFNSLKQEIENPNSRFYYRALHDRLLKLDTTLNQEDMFHLYYGSSVTDIIDPATTYAPPEDIPLLMKKEILSDEDNLILKNYFYASFRNKPLQELDNYLYASYFLERSGDTLQARAMKYLLFKIVDAILSTGNGNSPESAIHVISVDDEYFLLRLFNYSFLKQSLIEERNRKYDVLEYTTEEGKRGRVYFDVTHIFRQYETLFGNDDTE